MAPNQSPFLALPAELRKAILELVMGEDEMNMCRYLDNPPPRRIQTLQEALENDAVTPVSDIINAHGPFQYGHIDVLASRLELVCKQIKAETKQIKLDRELPEGRGGRKHLKFCTIPCVGRFLSKSTFEELDSLQRVTVFGVFEVSEKVATGPAPGMWRLWQRWRRQDHPHLGPYTHNERSRLNTQHSSRHLYRSLQSLLFDLRIDLGPEVKKEEIVKDGDTFRCHISTSIKFGRDFVRSQAIIKSELASVLHTQIKHGWHGEVDEKWRYAALRSKYLVTRPGYKRNLKEELRLSAERG